jgi:arylsulfatase A-like enzyme
MLDAPIMRPSILRSIRLVAAAFAAVVLATSGPSAPRSQARIGQPAAQSDEPPNIVFILADDLGYRELGVYGQKRIRTPRLDRMAAEGIRFTQFYSGSPVCAPSRATFLTGRHTGHAHVRNNYELGGFTDEEERGQLPLPPDHPNLARWLKTQGYTTAAIGKWGLGGPGSTGVPTKQGFDFFFGYLDQKQAHNYYPTHLWKNEERFPLRNRYFSPHQKHGGDPNDPAAYEKYTGDDYAIDRMTEEAVRFLKESRDKRFFLYFAPTIPHLALQVPQTALEGYAGKFPETPYLGDRQYLPHRTPRAAYAAMITYLDEQVGRLLDTLQEIGIDKNTVVFFTSDNGATWDIGGVDPVFFDSDGGLRGAKTDVYEGGIRVPMIARWPGRIKAGSVSDHVGANWDMWATFADLAGAPLKEATDPSTSLRVALSLSKGDGVSIAPALLGRPNQRQHDALYWEFHSKGSAQAVRMGRWKGVRSNVQKNPSAAVELYDLETDPNETTDVASRHPDLVRKIEAVMRQRTRSPIERWNF